jgi:hypothetical protein
MKNSKHILILAGLILLVFPLTLSAFEFDWGGNLFNVSEVASQPDGEIFINQIDDLTVWAEIAEVKDNGSVHSFAGQLFYEFSYEDEYMRPLVLDLDYLRYNGQFPGKDGSNLLMDINVGRFLFADPTGMVMDHTADGLSFAAYKPGIYFAFSAGYTGLLVSPRSNIRITSEDWADQDNEEEYYFGPRRMFGIMSVTFPHLKKLHTLSVFAAGQYDMGDPDDPNYMAAGGRTLMHTQYLGVSAERLYGRNLYGHFFLILQLSEVLPPDNEMLLEAGALLGFNWTYVREDWSNTQITFRILAAPPNYDLTIVSESPVGLSGYVPISAPTLGAIVAPTCSNLGLAELGFSFRPFSETRQGPANRLQLGLIERAFFRTWNTGVNWIPVDPESDNPFLGLETEGGIIWRPWSDIGLGLTGAVFVPMGGVMDTEDPLWAINLNFSVGF